MRRIFVVLSAMAAAMVMLHKSVYPDLGPSLGSGGGPAWGQGAHPGFPGKHKYIRMDVQDVVIRLKKATYAVDAMFHFFNTGPDVSVELLFPKAYFRHSIKENELLDFVRYDIWVEGRRLPVPKPPPHSLNVLQQVFFPGNQRTTIRVRYEVGYSDGSYGSGDMAYYQYGTGGTWKGTIGRAFMTVDGSEIGGTKGFAVEQIPGWRMLKNQEIMRLEALNLRPAHYQIYLYIKILKSSVSAK